MSGVEFAVIGDFGRRGPKPAVVAELVKSWDPDLVLTTGDNNYDRGAASTIDANVGQYYSQFIGNYKGSYGAGSGAENRFFPTLGNHDWGHVIGVPNPGGADPYLDYFTLPEGPGDERYYEFVRGPVHFFALDSDFNEPDGHTADSVQAQWLQSALAASTAPWKIVYMHEPPYSSGQHGSEPPVQWPYKQWGADAVLAGHDHTYERIINPGDGLPYFVNGLGGASRYSFGVPLPGSQVRYNAKDGAMRVNATDERITFEFVDVDGVVIDSYSLADAAAPPAAPAGLSATAVSANQIDLTWEDRSGVTESEFRIERSTDGVNFTQIGTVGPDVTRYQDRRLTGATRYWYRVRSANQAGPSVQTSNTDDATTAAAAGGALGQIVVPLGSTWKYLDNGSNAGIAWQSPSYDDAGWQSGPAQLGYGDGDEATVVGSGPDPANQHITTYFRKAFFVDDLASVSGLEVGLVVDDGAVVYLNGGEIHRENMPTGTITYTTPATADVDGAAESRLRRIGLGGRSYLVQGWNLLSVEVHQRTRQSPDVSFDLQLADVGLGGAAPVNPSARAVSNGRIDLAWTDSYPNESGFRIERSVDGVNYVPRTTLGANQTSYTDTVGLSPSTTYYYRVRAYQSGGGDSPPAVLTATTGPAGPTADVVDVSPDPRVTALGSVRIAFSEAVTGFGLSDLLLTRDGDAPGTNLLTGPHASLTTTDGGGVTWTLSGLDTVTGREGRYVLRLAPSAESGIVATSDGDPLAAPASEAWRVDLTPPAPPSTPNLHPTKDTGASNTDNVTSVTSPYLTGTAEGLSVIHAYDAGRLVGTYAANDVGFYDITVTGMAHGVHRLTVTATDAVGNVSAHSGELVVTVDTAAPAADVVDVSPGHRIGAGRAVDQVTITLSEPAPGLDKADLRLTRNGQAVSLANASLTAVNATTFTLSGLSSLTGAAGTYTLTVVAAGSGISDTAGNTMSANAADTWRVYDAPAVTGRWVFYNNSTHDGAGDDAAVAPGKRGLLPGETATAANVTSYSKGINGVMVDIVGLPTEANPTADDFEVRAGNSPDPGTWGPAPTPAVSFARAAGDGGSDRVTLVWPDGAIRNKWVQVTTKVSGDTGLTAPDVFYFGNAVGETFDTAATFAVNSRDVTRTRNAQAKPTTVGGLYDHNRDGRVNAQDLAIVRNSQGFKLATMSPALTGGAAATAGAGATPATGESGRTAREPASTEVSSPSSDLWGRRRRR